MSSLARRDPICSLRNSNNLLSTFTTRADDVIQRVIRVDHAGEFGADRIYAGQMTVLGWTSSGPIVQKMWNEEKIHLLEFQNLGKS